MTENPIACQDQIPGNHCFGCGPHNQGGLHIKSFWAGDTETVCHFLPQPHHCSGPTTYLNGGIASTLLDCHAVCSAMAQAYRQEGRAVGSGERIAYVTGTMTVTYKRPVPMAAAVELRASFVDIGPRKTTVQCRLLSGGQVCVEATVLAVRVPPDW
jgi:acyl-coenzyme A thioesterase PaaI-like protein